VNKQSKATTRFPVPVPLQQVEMYAEGAHEHTAMLILRHLQQLGLVNRFKGQPFALEEISGPNNRIPDLLVELPDASLHVIQCKSHRFLTDEVKNRFEEERICLNAYGIQFHIWTDRNKVGRPMSQSVRLLDRGFRYPPEPEVISSIRNRATQVSRLHELLTDFGWDDVIAAAAHCAIHIDIRETIHEETTASLVGPQDYISYFFARRHVPGGWWDSIAA
jgi:hypothetical protein